MGLTLSTQCLNKYAQNGTITTSNLANALTTCNSYSNLMGTPAHKQEKEPFLGFNPSQDHSAICIDYVTIFWILVIILIIIIIWKLSRA